jgi:hypothetical protein
MRNEIKIIATFVLAVSLFTLPSCETEVIAPSGYGDPIDNGGLTDSTAQDSTNWNGGGGNNPEDSTDWNGGGGNNPGDSTDWNGGGGNNPGDSTDWNGGGGNNPGDSTNWNGGGNSGDSTNIGG